MKKPTLADIKVIASFEFDESGTLIQTSLVGDFKGDHLGDHLGDHYGDHEGDHNGCHNGCRWGTHVAANKTKK